MRNLASTIAVGAAFAALSCSGSSSTMTGTGGGPGTAGDGGGTAGTSGAAGTGGSASGAAGTGGGAAGTGGATGGAAGGRGGTTGAAGTSGTGGSTTTLADPCRGTALPTTGHYVPSGMCARTIATGQGELRQLTFSSNGDLWGVIANGQIKRFRDANGDGVFQTAEIVNWASTGGNGQNVHIDEAGGYLYSGTNAGVRRWAWSNTTDAGANPQEVLTGQPTGGHGKHTVHVWDNWMYVHVRIERQRDRHQHVRLRHHAQHHQAFQHLHLQRDRVQLGVGRRDIRRRDSQRARLRPRWDGPHVRRAERPGQRHLRRQPTSTTTTRAR